MSHATGFRQGNNNNTSFISRGSLIAAGVIFTAVVAGLTLVLHAYVMRSAEHDITTMLLQHKGVHQYVQHLAHPEMHALKAQREMSVSLYSPVLFSSSYMVRNMHALYNEERRKAGLPELYYKMAAENPRNPVNRADAMELELINRFNNDKSLHHVERIIEEKGQKFLYVATPFLANEKRCLACHGPRANAPAQLRQKYPGEGGFNEQPGRIRAIESLKAPLKGEWTIPVIAMAATSILGLLLAGLAFGNHKLKNAVDSRTRLLTAQSKELKESENHLHCVLNSIGDAVIAVNDQGVITRMNPEAARLSGMSPEKGAGMPLDYVFQIAHPANDGRRDNVLHPHLERTKAVYASLLADNAVSTFTLLSHTGEKFEVSCHSSKLIGAKPNADGWVLIFRDITAQKTLEARLRQSEKMDAIGNLAGGIAHDFNNMLSGILGASELLQDPNLPPEKSKIFIKMIDHSAVRAAELTKSLLTFSRRATPEFVHLNVHQLLTDTHRILERTLDKRIVIEMDLQATASTVYGNAALLENALLNLGINAGKAMPDGGRLAFRSWNSLGNSGENSPISLLNIDVSDTGCGIAPEHLPHIFEPFFTTRPADEGTGLGLAATYGAIVSHHGEITVQSVPQSGSCFTVSLPVAEGSEEPQIEEGSLPKKTGTVLVVDDEPIVRQTTCALFQHMGFDVIEASNGRDAVGQYIAHQQQIDLVFLDMSMPEMNGAECFREIRKINAAQKVIVGSGYSEDGQIQQMKAEGLSGFIAKPFRRADLARIVNEVYRP
ncbi:MAG: DUF3365 domain-containing protein [Deltaproteobacteria bacterium]|nr:DUF3365 domain-containing protein [Deltaproteobacteria bacterium]